MWKLSLLLLLASKCYGGVTLQWAGSPWSGAYYGYMWVTNANDNLAMVGIPSNGGSSSVNLPDGVDGINLVVPTFSVNLHFSFSPQTNGYVTLDAGVPNVHFSPYPPLVYQSSQLQVDGVQAFIEGYGMMVPMFLLGWVRKFRQWGQSGAQNINL